ncbi:hypothetical protein D3C76_1744820 [compost metagenome]
MVVAKFGSLANDAASSLSVSRVPGAESTRPAIAPWTKAVVASCWVLVPFTAVGAVGAPRKAGESVMLNSAQADQTLE